MSLNDAMANHLPKSVPSMSPNPPIHFNQFLSLAEINALLPDTQLTEADLDNIERGRLVITKTADGLRKVHLGSLFELLKLHIH